MARTSSVFGLTVALLVHSLPRDIPFPFSVFYLLALHDVVGGVGRGEKQNTPEILGSLFPRLLNNDT